MMDPTYPPEADAYREKVQAFLAEHLPAGWKGIGALPRHEVEEFTRRFAMLVRLGIPVLRALRICRPRSSRLLSAN